MRRFGASRNLITRYNNLVSEEIERRKSLNDSSEGIINKKTKGK